MPAVHALPPLQVDLADIYMAGEPGALVYGLRSMVCYYGSHYFAFVLSPQLGQWLIFDDASVQSVGTWADVVAKCRLGRIQPSVLFYEAHFHPMGPGPVGPGPDGAAAPQQLR